QALVVLERPQEFANGLFFGSATAHGRAATHSAPNQSCVTARFGSLAPSKSGPVGRRNRGMGALARASRVRSHWQKYWGGTAGRTSSHIPIYVIWFSI